MTEYIEREALLEKAEEIEWWNETTGFYDHIRIVHAYDVEDAPTADVVEVVRCKDCKHSRICVDNGGVIMCILDSEKDEETDIDYGFLSFHSENHYCSYGKRKEGAEE